MNINERLNSLIDAEIERRLEAFFNETDKASKPRIKASESVPGESEPTWNRSETTPETTTRKRGRGRAKVGYVSIHRGRIPSDLIPTWESVFKAVVKAGRPVSARELESLSGEKQKTVESSLYQLRHLRLVKSVKLPRR